ncbi:hypothetical protein [Caballeronia zhejiangensis]|nr:hypothetical protein [Caballeronia zhejiangensis]
MKAPIETIGTMCRYARSMYTKPWRKWLDAPFDENACEFFDPLAPAEIERRAELRAKR